jgi:polyisoprenoid-binding protein YceI
LQEFALDAGHSIVEFSIGFAFSRVKGRFTQVHGTILYDPATPANSSITAIIESKSIDTGWPHRDEHLRSNDFFEVERFPTITFQSTRLSPLGPAWVAEGRLTMHGVERSIRLPFHLLQPPTRSPESQWLIVNAAGAIRLARRDFGIMGGSSHNSWFTAARNATMADSVDVSLEIEGWLADAESQRSARVDQAVELIRTSGVNAQLDRFRQLKATTPDSTFERYFQGGDRVVRALIAGARLREAVELSRGLIDLFPQTASAHLVHGFALSASGDAAAAARQYARAREVYRPAPPSEQVDDWWWYSDQLVRTALEWGRTREAVGLAYALTGIYSTTARAHVTYGLALMASGDTGSAEAAFERALTLDPIETRAIEWKRRLRH